MQILLVSPKNVATPKRTKQAANYKAFYSFLQRSPPFFYNSGKSCTRVEQAA